MAGAKNHDYHILAPDIWPIVGAFSALTFTSGMVLNMHDMPSAKLVAPYSGEADFAIGGGVEVMSRVPMGSDGGAWPTDPSSAFKTYFAPQGISADLIATMEGWHRADVDAFALESQKRATAAQAAGYFDRSVMPVKDFMGQVTQLNSFQELQKMTKLLEALTKSKGGTAPAWLMSHPATAQRIAAIEANEIRWQVDQG